MIKVIFWDFDGVLIDSNAVRDLGFELVLADFNVDQVEQLLVFHRLNGGLSRYVKFRYFFEEILKVSITDDDILVLAERFSVIMKDLLVNPTLLITKTIEFAKENQGNYIMHITSGSDQKELRYLCKSMNIAHLFHSIHGSPKPKKQLVKELIDLNTYNPYECVLIGDSLNDFEAAKFNNVNFCAFNNDSLEKYSNVKVF